MFRDYIMRVLPKHFFVIVLIIALDKLQRRN